MSVLRAEPADGRLTVDRLATPHDPVEVVLFDTLEVGCDGDAIREPHRHDYHELIWTRKGVGRHMLDNRTVPVVPGTITVIGKGQVHVFERAHGLVGAAMRFGDELLHEGPIARSDPAWLFAGCGGWNVTVPESYHAPLEAAIATLKAESAGPLDARSADLQRHLLSVLLLWIERWYDGQRTERRDGEHAAALELFRRFSRVLERDFSAHHDAGWYADALAMPPAALSHALSASRRQADEGARHRPRHARGRAPACASPTAPSARSPSRPASATRCTSRAPSSATRPAADGLPRPDRASAGVTRAQRCTRPRSVKTRPRSVMSNLDSATQCGTRPRSVMSMDPRS